jgi:hydroxyacylglutathione hydrolase
VDQVRQARLEGRATVPSVLQAEWMTNPFLRVREPAVIEAASTWRGEPVSLPVDCLAAVRAWKDVG